jgi:iron complex outermembrane receptor protein
MALAGCVALPLASAQMLVASNLADLSLEELANVRITSVSGRPEPAQDAAASVYIITAEDIRRSAATSLPEALRLAPNLQVARINASQYAISARGFNNAIGNKLLVLIDGRIVYSPLFAGVFWDAQDVVLHDIERIEVISGPGATLWGANAVNGVINVITRAAADTQGAYAQALAGRNGAQATAQYGGSLGSQGHYRLYATRLTRPRTENLAGTPQPDGTDKNQGGFRADWGGALDQLTLQGDIYAGGANAASNSAPRLSGANLLGRWKRQFVDGSNWQLQAYYDQERREDEVLFGERTQTFDIQFNHAPVTAPGHKVLWGAGYRHARSQASATPLVLLNPEVRKLQWTHLFAQDEIRLSEPLHVTVGAKFETNVYTGLEFLPTVRAAWQFEHAGLLWGALSRAVRAPARLDRDFFLPSKPIPGIGFLIEGGPDFKAEIANVVELGYRAQPTPRLSYSLTAFHHDYRRLRGGTPAPSFVENRLSGVVEGLEAWGTFSATPNWRLSGGLVELRKSMRSLPGTSPNSIADLGNDPKHQWKLRSSVDLPHRVEFDVLVRHVSALPEPVVARYTATDLRLGWRATPKLTVSLLGQNVFDPRHIEYGAMNAANEIPRSIFLMLEWLME